MKAYIISDTHYFHNNIIEYCGRPVDHCGRLFESTMKIKPEDLLIHLGDISMGHDQETFDSYIAPLQCRKVLIMGNHDTKSWSWYMEHGWDFVCDAFRLKYCGKIVMFSHTPQPWDGVWEVNIHGHLHNLGHRAKEFKELKRWHRLYAPELMNYQPVELSKFIQTEPKE